MTVRELITQLKNWPEDYEVFVDSPNGDDDYFVDKVSGNNPAEQVFIETAQ